MACLLQTSIYREGVNANHELTPNALRAMPRSGPHILVVDDDPSIREALAAALKGTYVVHGAATGAEGFTASKRCRNASSCALVAGWNRFGNCRDP